MERWKAKPDPQFLYDLQLALETLVKKQHGLLKMETPDEWEIVEDLLEAEEPAVAMRYLTADGEGEPVIYHLLEARAADPAYLGELLLLQIRDRIRAAVPVDLEPDHLYDTFR